MVVYHGEIQCESIVKSTGNLCTNRAYLKSDDKYTCDVHSKHAKDVISLPIDPNKLKKYNNELIDRKAEIDKIANNNKSNGTSGIVIVSKLYMMKNPEYVSGYLNVFPNYKHQNRIDGYGCMKLSPKSLGPVVHNMPNLPEANTIENYHQFSKFWEFELDENGNILDQYKLDRINAYTSLLPMRHKHDKKTLLKYNKNVNIPKFSMYYDKYGNEHRYNYLQCRYFYCHFYEILARKEPDFITLKKMIEDGYNLNICGYDGYNVNKNLMEHYTDISRPFGHELVLYTMLTVNNPDNYPWNIYYKDNYTIYADVI